MARATGWVFLAVSGLFFIACSVSSHTAADEKASSDAPRAGVNTPHDPAPPPAPAAPAHATVAPRDHPPMPTEPAAADQEEHGGVSVRFGIMPDYGNDKPGVLAAEVFPGTPADLGGIKPGDRMTRWNGKDVPDVEGWMPFLEDARPGDKVIVTFIRDGKEMKTEVLLKARE